MRISDWSSDVCSSDLAHGVDCQRGYLVSEFTALQLDDQLRHAARLSPKAVRKDPHPIVFHRRHFGLKCHQPVAQYRIVDRATLAQTLFLHQCDQRLQPVFERVGIAQHSALMAKGCLRAEPRSEEHTSALKSLKRISYAVLCLK